MKIFELLSDRKDIDTTKYIEEKRQQDKLKSLKSELLKLIFESYSHVLKPCGNLTERYKKLAQEIDLKKKEIIDLEKIKNIE